MFYGRKLLSKEEHKLGSECVLGELGMFWQAFSHCQTDHNMCFKMDAAPRSHCLLMSIHSTQALATFKSHAGLQR